LTPINELRQSEGLPSRQRSAVVEGPSGRTGTDAGQPKHVNTADSPSDQTRLVAALADPARFGQDCTRVTHLETHISHVFLTGKFAYKIKKPVDLGFLDFTTLDRRRFCCEEEVRLNGRLVNGAGVPVEYAVRMREFAQETLASRMLAGGTLTAAHIDALAAEVAAFHGRIDVASPDSVFGTAETVLRVAMQNFDQIRPLLTEATDQATLATEHAWTLAEHAARHDAFRRRHDAGFVRECHGDLHLGNIAVLDGEATVFDCIEFNAELRWIDVMSEVAFTVMDLEDRGRPDYGHRFLNDYLERTGDYAGLAVFRFYLAYRAMVRAKVACLRGSQLVPGEAKTALATEYRGYVDLARRYAQPPRPGMVVTHGFSGCGKTTLTQSLLELCGAIRIRTDVERKRLHGMTAGARSGSALDAGLYTSDATERTYRQALALAEEIAAAGRIAIVDGTFLKRWQRDLFRERTASLGIPFVLIDFTATEPTLRARVAERAVQGTDASEADLAVLEHQLRTREALGPDELPGVVRYDAEAPFERARDPSAWHDVLEPLGAP
jgi:aminoglycoside phosphotransferase family enzyme/predicted kinase